MFGAFVVKKWHFPPESPEFRRKVAEFRRKVAEFRPEFPEFRFLNLNSPSVRKMRFSAEFRPEFRFRWSAGFVKKTKRWTLATPTWRGRQCTARNIWIRATSQRCVSWVSGITRMVLYFIDWYSAHSRHSLASSFQKLSAQLCRVAEPSCIDRRPWLAGTYEWTVEGSSARILCLQFDDD